MEHGFLNLIATEDKIILISLYIIPIIIFALLIMSIGTTLEAIKKHLEDIYFKLDEVNQNTEKDNKLDK